jgi:hypothetical protein
MNPSNPKPLHSSSVNHPLKLYIRAGVLMIDHDGPSDFTQQPESGNFHIMQPGPFPFRVLYVHATESNCGLEVSTKLINTGASQPATPASSPAAPSSDAPSQPDSTTTDTTPTEPAPSTPSGDTPMAGGAAQGYVNQMATTTA